MMIDKSMCEPKEELKARRVAAGFQRLIGTVLIAIAVGHYFDGYAAIAVFGTLFFIDGYVL